MPGKDQQTIAAEVRWRREGRRAGSLAGWPCAGLAWIFLLALLLVPTGCGSFKKERQLERVARDWCMTIRASQVIPIYPLSEDVTPGDIFLVETPAARQAKDYNHRGYLPLDHLVGRIHSTAYPDFYLGAFGIGTASNTPHHWQFPDALQWSNAPLAGFPTYTVEVKRSGGINAAFPISSVPVGLTLLGASHATATVALQQAHTYGLDTASLQADFTEWQKTNRDLILPYAQYATESPRFLRLVSRVYVLRQVNVTLTDDRSASASASGGVPKPVDLLDPAKADLAANYSSAVATLEKLVAGLSESLPGGTLKLAAASSRSVSMNETFARPVVIGYIAQDYPILANGSLGPPVSTLEVLEGRLNPTARAILDERAQAGLLAEAAIATLQRLRQPADVQRAVRLARESNLVTSEQTEQWTALAATEPKSVVAKLVETLRMTAQTGHVSARCDLDRYLAALTAP